MTTPLQRCLNTKRILLRIQATEKEAIIRELVDVLVAAGGVTDRDEAARAILDREKEMSTGLHNNVAIPHGKSDTVEELQAVIGLKPEGVDFECVDGQPAKIFACMVSPTSQTGPHIRFMADISRLLRHEDIRERILSAETTEDVVAILAEQIEE